MEAPMVRPVAMLPRGRRKFYLWSVYFASVHGRRTRRIILFLGNGSLSLPGGDDLACLLAVRGWRPWKRKLSILRLQVSIIPSSTRNSIIPLLLPAEFLLAENKKIWWWNSGQFVQYFITQLCREEADLLMTLARVAAIGPNLSCEPVHTQVDLYISLRLAPIQQRQYTPSLRQRVSNPSWAPACALEFLRFSQ